MKHFLLQNTYETHKYTGEGSGGKRRYLQRDRVKHGQYVLAQLDELWEKNRQRGVSFSSVRSRGGTYIEFRGADNCELATKSLENIQKGIYLLNSRTMLSENKNEVQAATVFIPEGKENYFNNKVRGYLEENTLKNNPKNKELVESIETISLAALSAFWVGDLNDMPDNIPIWCEYWLRADVKEEADTAEAFYSVCDEMNIQHKDKCIFFPEKAVVMARTNKEQMQNLVNVNAYIAEIRRAPETKSFYTKMNGMEGGEWIKEMLERRTGNPLDTYVCILDTGVNYSHPLLKDALSKEHAQTINKIWGTDDRDGHGTEMAGVCEYFALEDFLISSGQMEINHSLESVKILSKDETAGEPELYGAITADATSLADLANPNVKRVYCMAVTTDKYTIKDGAPSSWSGELDNIISGVEDENRKLFIVSAGNVLPDELKVAQYPDANTNHSVENPGQAWNAITVGAYAGSISIPDEKEFEGWSPVAALGELSPFSSTSITWDVSKWPVKPEILLDGGNVITDGQEMDICDETSILTTNRRFLERPFTTINATSAATAQAAFIASELLAAYPDLWEETIRALMIHSAEWTEQMKEQFCQNSNKTSGIRNLLRHCGYGIADLQRAKESLENSVSMIIQAEIQPYTKEDGRCKMKEMHLHEIPWPKEVLESLGNTEVTMKVTLSYYIEPAPDQKGWNNRYRYASGALRFEVINKNQSKNDFVKRVNAAAREDGKSDRGNGDSGSGRWFLGKDNRDVGSVHSDLWTGAAVDLAQCNYIAVYPVVGWWRERHNLHRYYDKMRYALVVSISTPENGVDFYMPIKTIIEEKLTTTIPKVPRNI